MRNPYLTAQQVKALRRLIRNGAPVKEVADRFRVPYGVAYNAVRGTTWSSITEPPPLPAGHLTKRRRRRADLKQCSNCGEECTRSHRQRCLRCYAHLRRHGEERREESVVFNKQHRVSEAELRALHERYEAGASLSDVAAACTFSQETLRRRFRQLGLPIRSSAGTSARLTAAMVRQCRKLHYDEGVPVADLARRYSINYATMYSAVTWQTWRSAGGPGSEQMRVKVSDDVHAPCERCGVLTAHSSGRCRWCRVGR